MNGVGESMDPNLLNYLDNEGYKCVICEEVYSLSVRERKPAQLSCGQHNLCIECFEKSRRSNLKNCPECRRALTFTAAPVDVNSQMIRQIELAIKTWRLEQQLANAGSAASAAAQAASPAVVKAATSSEKVQRLEPPPVPANFQCLSLCEYFWQYRNVGNEIESTFPYIVPIMGWQHVANDLQGDFKPTVSQWILYSDRRNQQAKGIAWMKPLTQTQWESHWGGIVENKTELYVELYKQILACVGRTRQGYTTDWKTVSLTTYFDFDREEKWLNCILDFLRSHNIRFKLDWRERGWGEQAILTTYPCAKDGHTQIGYILDPNGVIEQDKSYEATVAPHVQEYLETLNLNTLFRLWASTNAYNREEGASQIKTAFSQQPHNFFVYTLDGKAKGFMQFERIEGNLSVKACYMYPDAHKFADHFVQSFSDWAKTQPTYAKGVSAKTVLFSFACRSAATGQLRTALDKMP